MTTETWPTNLISVADGDRLWCDATTWPAVEGVMLSIYDADPDFQVEEWEIVPATEQSPAYSRCGNPIYPALGCHIYGHTQGDGARVAREFRKDGGHYFPTGDWWYLA